MSQQLPPSDDVVRDGERLQELLDLDLLSDREDPILQKLVSEATEELGLPIGLVSIVLHNAQYFAASKGLQGWLKEVRGTPLEWSFCVNVVRDDAPFVVEDASHHPKVKDNPLVSQDGIRSYAGVPIRSRKGKVLGSFCVIGDRQRRFTEEEIERLNQWADRAVARLEERRNSVRES